MNSTRQVTKAMMVVSGICLLAISSTWGQTIDEINKAAISVPLTNRQAVAEYVAQYGKEVEPLSGYGMMPWGISPRALEMLFGEELKGEDFKGLIEQLDADEKLTSEKESEILEAMNAFMDSDDVRSSSKLKGICIAPYPGVYSGKKSNRKHEFYFVDSKFMGMWMSYKKKQDWQVLLTALTQKYGQPSRSRENNTSDFMVEYVIYEWGNDIGFVRMVLAGPRHVIGRLQQDKVDRARRDVEVMRAKARMEGATEIEIQQHEQMASAMLNNIEQSIAQDQKEIKLIGISYGSVEYKKYAENKLQLHYQALKDKEMQKLIEQEQMKERRAQKYLNEI